MMKLYVTEDNNDFFHLRSFREHGCASGRNGVFFLFILK